MKRAFLIFILAFLFLVSACANNSLKIFAPSPTATAIPSGWNGGFGPTQKPAGQTAAPSAAPTHKSSLYDPSIFVIEASGSWREEIETNYFVDYECEIYLHKIDANNNRVSTGVYEGVFWMKETIDASEYMKDMFKDAPVAISFDLGGEAVNDHFGISLNTEDDKAWVDYSIMGEDGKPLPLTRETPVAKGSFVTVAKNIYLEARARGAQGEKVDYESKAGTGDLIDINYVIHVEPDAIENGTTRKVVINLSGENFSKTIEGVMKRLPGYPEDVSDYYNSSAYQQQSARQHLT
ncbi:MAG: hypothetical protein ACYCX2_05880 [Christensenellales bacterium]